MNVHMKKVSDMFVNSFIPKVLRLFVRLGLREIFKGFESLLFFNSIEANDPITFLVIYRNRLASIYSNCKFY